MVFPENKMMIGNNSSFEGTKYRCSCIVIVFAFKCIYGLGFAAFYVAIVHVLCIGIALTAYIKGEQRIACGACP